MKSWIIITAVALAAAACRHPIDEGVTTSCPPALDSAPAVGPARMEPLAAHPGEIRVAVQNARGKNVAAMVAMSARPESVWVQRSPAGDSTIVIHDVSPGVYDLRAASVGYQRRTVVVEVRRDTGMLVVVPLAESRACVWEDVFYPVKRPWWKLW